MSEHSDQPPALEPQAKLNELVQQIIDMGASDARILAAGDVAVEDHLAALCKETRCENYGLSPTCPPNVEGPAWLREYLATIDHALVIKLDLPDDVIYSDQRREVGKLLHFFVIQAERAAREMGFARARAFAGGSCKKLFCPDEAKCNVLHGDGQCRNPDMARPSISGFGINTNGLLKATGWDRQDPDVKLNTRLGLVLLGQ